MKSRQRFAGRDAINKETRVSIVFLIDTDIIIYSLKGVPEVVARFGHHAASPKALSVISYGELVYGAANSDRKTENMARIVRIRELFPVVDATTGVMEIFGNVKAELRRSGKTVDDFDLIIAATALSLNYALVTNNEKHFKSVPGLNLVNWTKPLAK